MGAGVDPRAYGRQYEAQLRSAEMESIQDYIAQSDNLAALHSEVGACGAAPERVLPQQAAAVPGPAGAPPCGWEVGAGAPLGAASQPALLPLLPTCLTGTPNPPSQPHRQIEECDGILGEMEGMLGRFQSDLGSISSEIRMLQEQSQRMSLQLRNRKMLQVPVFPLP